MAILGKKSLRWAIPVLVVVVILIATHSVWLRFLGRYLVKSDEPFKADVIVVLAGDLRGGRILKAGELMRQGYAPKVLVSGPPCCFGQLESELAISFAIKQGYPAESFLPVAVKRPSSVGEAQDVVAELDRLGAKRFIVVTSNYHTRRAYNIYSKLVPHDRFRMVAADDWAFRPDDWWRSRPGRKQAANEWIKTVTSWVGL